MKYLEKESAVLEFKAQMPNKQQIIKTIVAFCNHFGGKLVIGVKDDRTICGLDEQGIDNLIESLYQSIYQGCQPTIIPSIYTQRIQENLILIIEVSAGMNKPYFIKSLGLNEGVFVRVGSHTMKATVSIIQELTWRGKGFFVDEMPVYSANAQDVDEARFVYFLKEHRKTFNTHLSDKVAEQLLHYKILIKEHQRIYPTLGGMLLFGKNPQIYFPEAFIICSHFQGVAGRDAIAAKDCSGDLFAQLNDAINFVTSRLNQQFTIVKVKRQQQLEIPEVALREMIVNAIVHRDYTLPGPIKIAIYDDRVEIFSPGNFPGPLKINQLEMGITYVRNHIISKIFREAGYIEKLGSGFLTLFKSYREMNLQRPEIIEGTGFIKCILPRAGDYKAVVLEDDQTTIMRLFYTAPEITVSDVVREQGISRQTAGRRLSALVKAGQLECVGKGAAVKYRRVLK
jgi:ATP-dependent DNA helicase RecG